MAELEDIVAVSRVARRPSAQGEAPLREPPPYPDGWYRIAASDEVPPGRALAVEALGRAFVVFRGEKGTVAVLDGHCPHMGARLGTDGRAADGCVRCPYHGWRIDGRGRVVDIPYAPRAPTNLRTRSFVAREVHDQVFVWHGEHVAGPEPEYELPVVSEIEAGTMPLRGQRSGGKVRMHVMDFVQNAADVHHFSTLHRRFRVPFTRIRVPGSETILDATWHVDPDAPHVSWLTVHGMARFFGYTARALAATARVQYLGPGGIARFHFEHESLGRIVLDQTLLPIAPLLQRVHFRWYADRSVPRLFVGWVVGQWIAQWQEDVAIWSTMERTRRPRLVREDGAILQMQRWYRRFWAGEGSGGQPSTGSSSRGSGSGADAPATRSSLYRPES